MSVEAFVLRFVCVIGVGVTVACPYCVFFFFFSSRRRHTRSDRDWSSDVCSSDLLWELLSPLANDPVYMQLPGQFRAELHDRFMAPIYPFAFAALTFAFLGAPRTTRQSRNFSMSSAILAVFGLRMAGFACSVMAVKSPLAPIVQYLMLTVAIGASLWIILGGIVVEPPAALIEAINKSNARLLRLLGRPAT